MRNTGPEPMRSLEFTLDVMPHRVADVAPTPARPAKTETVMREAARRYRRRLVAGYFLRMNACVAVP